MSHVFSWWIAVEILGLAALPLAWRLFRNLPDRGYILAKPLGILLTSYLFWLGVTFGFLSNTPIAIVLVVLLVAGGSLVACARQECEPEGSDGPVAYRTFRLSANRLQEFWLFLRQNRRVIVSSELVFSVAFVLWAVVRAYNPEISATEKPMDFAFLNGILRSERFPPLDPWLSGFAISYYYFGYLIMAVLTRLTGVPSEVAFNLAIALLFALTASGSFSLTYNLVRRYSQQRGDGQGIAVLFGALGSVFVAVVGNLEGLLETLHARGLGSPSFWQWMDIKNLAQAPVTGSWVPADNWWWWRASRVVHDVILGVDVEVIDEFPFFSFLLGDMHPHVLGLPFVLLALGLALNLFWSQREAANWELVVLGACIGGLGFLNSWDLPIYLSMCVVAYAVAAYARLQGFSRRWIADLAVFALALAALAFLLYLPFWISFRSQAGGIAPVLLVKTQLHQYLVMFGMFIYVVTPVLFCWLWRMEIGLMSDNEKGGAGRRLGLASVGALILVVLVCLLMALLKLYLIALLVLLIGVGLLVFAGRLASFSIPRLTSSTTFVLLLVLAALLLTLSVEFVYLRDSFGTRMNTVFKFYYQAWVLFAISSAFGIYYLTARANRRRKILSSLWFSGSLLLLVAALVYPILATHSKTNGFGGRPTLNGMAYLEDSNPDDLAAIRWLRANVDAAPVILEATGGSYSYYGRISVHTGLPTLLGWGGHELQWRGNYEEPGKREPDIETLYTSPDPELTVSLLEKYDITYVYVGGLERRTYHITQPVLDKFASLMDVVYQQGEVTIYRRGD